MSTNPIKWRREYAVAVTRGSRTKFGYGFNLRDAVLAAGVRPNEGFAHALFERGAVQWSELGASGKTYIHHGTMKRLSKPRKQRS